MVGKYRLLVQILCLAVMAMAVIGLWHRHTTSESSQTLLQNVNRKHIHSLFGTKGSIDAAAAGAKVKYVEVESPLDPVILRDLRRLSVSHDLAHADVINMTSQQRELTIHSVLDNTDTVCNRKLRMGNLGDGGWEICDDDDVRPRAPCVVYSFGIDNDFSFDDDTALTYGCHVFSFDPSMKAATHNRSDLVHFYKIGIAGQTKVTPQGWKLYTFSDIRKLLGHENTQIDVVKMDIENSEWGAMDAMVRAGEMKRFKQFLVEYHLHAFDHLKLLQGVDKEGYKTFYTNKNINCGKKVNGFPGKRTICYEVHYLRRTT